MKLSHKAMLVNLTILGTLVYYYFNGRSLLVLFISAAITLTIANAIFVMQWRAKQLAQASPTESPQ